MATASPHPLLDALHASSEALLRVPSATEEYRRLTDDQLTAAVASTAVLQRAVHLLTAVAAGEVAHRSRSELGSSGFAQRTGHRTPEEWMRATSGSTARDAVTAVRVGRLVHEATTVPNADGAPHPEPRHPWLAGVAAAVADGRLIVPAAEAIRAGLGEPVDGGIDAGQLTRAAGQLCDEAPGLDADRLFRRARQLRDELDVAGVADREAARRARRALVLSRLPDGMGLLRWTMDSETLAVVQDVFDRATSPRRGGPRFSPADQTKAERILADDRSVPQLASDSFLHLLTAGAAADDSVLLGAGLPAVRVLVTASELTQREGRGYLEGQHDAVSIATVERVACSAGTLAVVFDAEGRPLDVGRESRVFTARQKIALATRDGGCMVKGCDRPPSWTEAHHIRFWKRDGGRTDIDDGILFCKHHHLLFHNNGWEVERRGAGYWAIPPADVDPTRTPVELASKSAAYRQLRARAG